MSRICRLIAVGLLLATCEVSFAETHPEKRFEAPKFFVGCPVVWADGSEGKVVGRAVFEDEEWMYLVQLGGEDGLCWRLPERGLKYNESAE